jgi:uncharacterized membrane protein
MYKTIEDYLNALKRSMQGCDPALVQDALSDAQEHLSLALEAARESAPQGDEADLLARIAEEYGSPDETAAAYREVERRTSPTLIPTPRKRSVLGRFFAVYLDPRAWGALLYLLISTITGMVYFTWAVTAVSFSISFAIFIFGLLIAAFFILTLRGLALIEGRLVDSLLGVRMPRRPLFVRTEGNWWETLKANLVDSHTWRMLVYMIVQMPLGVIYFTIVSVLLVLSLGYMASPILQIGLGVPLMSIGDARIFLPSWAMPLAMLGGFLLLTVTLHIVRAIGGLHGRYAKWMLVAE